jgi:Winged helix-turn helix
VLDRYHHEVHIYRLLHKWGFKPKVPQRRFVNTASKEEKGEFKKKTREIISNIPKDFTVAVEDESIFVHDTLARRRMWIPKGKRPIVVTTGSHQKTCVFGYYP